MARKLTIKESTEFQLQDALNRLNKTNDELSSEFDNRISKVESILKVLKSNKKKIDNKVKTLNKNATIEDVDDIVIKYLYLDDLYGCIMSLEEDSDLAVKYLEKFMN